jgi:hypothetical protein
MDILETKKLFYNKYAYKIVIYNRLASIFRSELQRGNKLSFARAELDRMHAEYDNGVPITKRVFRSDTIIPTEDFFDAQDVYKILKKSSNEYMIRIGIGNDLIIYSHNKEFLLSIGKKVRSTNIKFYEPHVDIKEFLEKNKDVVIVKNQPKFPIKVILGRKKSNLIDLANWLKLNHDKSKVGNRTLSSLEEGLYVDGLYFYVRDEKVLQLVYLMCGDNIRKIEKLVWQHEIDKYKYGSE